MKGLNCFNKKFIIFYSLEFLKVAMKNECLEWKLGDEYEKLAFTFKVILHVITHLSEKKTSYNPTK